MQTKTDRDWKAAEGRAGRVTCAWSGGFTPLQGAKELGLAIFRVLLQTRALKRRDRRAPVPAIAFAMLLALLFLPVLARGQDAQAGTAQTKTIVERGLNHRVVQTTNGAVYTELGTGMHFVRDGQMLESKEEVLIDANGYGVADQGQHSVRFSPSITDSPAIVYTDPDGNILRVRPLGLAYLEYGTGSSNLFSEIKPSIGAVKSNPVTYADAFTNNISADIVYRYKKGSFEADVAVRAQLPPPSNWNMDPNHVRLQVWHELLDPPTPKVQTTSYIYREPNDAVRQSFAEPDFKDTFFSFGTMQIGRGSAFLMDSDAIRQACIDVAQEVPVGKEMVQAQDPNTGLINSYLVESIELSTVQPLLDTLPTAALSKPGAGVSRLAALKQTNGLKREEFLASLPRHSRAGFQPASEGGVSPAKQQPAHSLLYAMSPVKPEGRDAL